MWFRCCYSLQRARKSFMMPCFLFICPWLKISFKLVLLLHLREIVSMTKWHCKLVWYIVFRGPEKERVHVYAWEWERERECPNYEFCLSPEFMAIANTQLFDVHEYEVLWKQPGIYTRNWLIFNDGIRTGFMKVLRLTDLPAWIFSGPRKAKTGTFGFVC